MGMGTHSAKCLFTFFYFFTFVYGHGHTFCKVPCVEIWSGMSTRPLSIQIFLHGPRHVVTDSAQQFRNFVWQSVLGLWVFRISLFLAQPTIRMPRQRPAIYTQTIWHLSRTGRAPKAMVLVCGILFYLHENSYENNCVPVWNRDFDIPLNSSYQVISAHGHSHLIHPIKGIVI